MSTRFGSQPTYEELNPPFQVGLTDNGQFSPTYEELKQVVGAVIGGLPRSQPTYEELKPAEIQTKRVDNNSSHLPMRN